jgi:predicted transposase YbfD/YdcC
MAQETTFYQELASHPDLDLRDNRGKRLNLALVLIGVMIGLLRKRDGALSSIHRSMVYNQKKLCRALLIQEEQAVSRAHLPRILAKVKRSTFEALFFEHYGIELNEQQREWFAGDGKELRGSIEKGDKRGEASVQIARHRDGAVAGQAFYNGTKESEKPCLYQLIDQTGVKSQKITVDALHLYPSLTKLVHGAGGEFIIGLKENQKGLHEDMVSHAEAFSPKVTHQTVDKGHGRLDIRSYACFDVSGEYFEDRWSHAGFNSLLRVKRTSTKLKTNDSSEETAYYITNGKAENAYEYFEAVRNHWSIEVNNHCRDVSLQEDRLRTKKSLLHRYCQASEPLYWNCFGYGILRTG